MPRASRRSNGNRQKTSPKANSITAAISDDESISDGADFPESIPAKASKSNGKSKADSEPEELDASDDQAEDEYVVEEIMDHKAVRGVTKYKVKWLGYDDEADMTWEPTENL